MAKYFVSYYMLFFVTNSILAQTSCCKMFQGKVIANYKDLDGIYVINQNTEKATITTDGGYFSIAASVGDTLILSAVQFKAVRYIIQDQDFVKDMIFVKMEIMMRNLNEVMVMQYKNINAVALGIISKDTKSYTPAERKLKVANSLGITGNTDGTTGGSFSVDPLFNWITGRTAMLKKELVVERNEIWLSNISDRYSDDFFVKKLKINPIDIKGFKYYIVENAELIDALKAKNKSMARFLMAKLAVDYNQFLEDEKK